MKLDVDLIRKILLWCEENTPAKKPINTATIKIDNYSNFEISNHFGLLIDAGYIKAGTIGTFPDKNYFIQGLTLDGYQYLEAIKSDTLWNKYKETARKMGIEAVRFALPILADHIKHQLGLP